VANQISSASLIATLSDIARSNKRADKHQKNISGKNKYYYENKKNAKNLRFARGNSKNDSIWTIRFLEFFQIL
jgi:hypothetical protein